MHHRFRQGSHRLRTGDFGRTIFSGCVPHIWRSGQGLCRSPQTRRLARIRHTRGANPRRRPRRATAPSDSSDSRRYWFGRRVARTPSHCGSILWEDAAEVDLEGVGSRFPVHECDFASDLALPSNAAWYLDVDDGDPDCVIHPMRVPVYQFGQAPHCSGRARGRSAESEGRAIAELMYYDLARSFVQLALENPGWFDDSPSPATDSLRATTRRLIRSLLGRIYVRAVAQPGDDPVGNGDANSESRQSAKQLTMYLFPRLPRLFAQQLAVDILTKTPTELAVEWQTAHPRAEFTASGFPKASDAVLKDLRFALLTVAERHGYPNAHCAASARADVDCGLG